MVGYSQWGMWVCMTIFPILQKISLKDLFCQNFIPRLSNPKSTRNMNKFLHIINIEKFVSLFYVYRLGLWKLGHGVKQDKWYTRKFQEVSEKKTKGTVSNLFQPQISHKIVNDVDRRDGRRTEEDVTPDSGLTSSVTIRECAVPRSERVKDAPCTVCTHHISVVAGACQCRCLRCWADEKGKLVDSWTTSLRTYSRSGFIDAILVAGNLLTLRNRSSCLSWHSCSCPIKISIYQSQTT